MELATTERTSGVIYVLLTNHYATLKELRDDYSIDEVLDMYEACMVCLYNKAEMMTARKARK